MAGTDSSRIIYFEEPSIILMEVQLPENLGMVMRAMLNFGFKKLRLVKPKIDWKDTKVKSSSAGAYDTISSTVKVYESLEKSIEDIEFLCATSVRRRDLDSFVDFPRNIIENINKKYRRNSIAFLFGAEKAGLKNKDLSHANTVINIPSIKAFGSLNLAMSVNIICYEWYLNKHKLEGNYHYHKEDLANKKEINFFNNRLIKVLKTKKFFSNKEEDDKLTINVRNIFSKNNLTNKELRILHGIITTLKNKRND